MIKLCACRHIKRKVWAHPPTVKIHTAKDFGTELGQQDIGSLCTGIGGQATTILSAEGDPKPAHGLVTNLGTGGVALILGDGKPAGVCQTGGGITPQKQTSGDRSLSDAGLIRVAYVAGKTVPERYLQANLFTDDPCFGEGGGKVYTGIEQDIIVGV